MKHIVLISKDVLSTRFLPTYGNTHFKTPHIDELAKKGTVFLRHYTAAPSTAMSFTSMFTGKYPYETGRANYSEVKEFDIKGGTTLFDQMEQQGFSCHLVWSTNYVKMAERFSRCYGKNTVHHESIELNQYVGAHMPGRLSELRNNDEALEETYGNLLKEIDTIDNSKPVFLWVHLPHVMKGRTGYGTDIDVLDRFVGDVRKRFGDYIFITADHGCNDGKDGKTGYGFDVYESSIRIPLITPRLENCDEYTGLTSNVDLGEMILNSKIKKREYIISDTAYYQQPHRKIAIIKGNYKFVYEKAKREKKVFDVIEDPCENINLLKRIMPDIDRHRKVVTDQVLYYPYWDEVPRVKENFDSIFELIWNDGDAIENIENKFRNYIENRGRYIKALLRIAKKKISEKR